MIVDLREARDQDVVVDVHLVLSEVTDETGSTLLTGPVHLAATARPGKLGVEFSGRIEAEVRLSCSRCLEPCRRPICSDFFLNVVIKDSPESPQEENEIGAEGDDATLFRAPDGRLDLGRVASELIYLDLPLKPLCSETCAGLCPSCGANRNRIECGCRSERIDPRLSGLEDLMRRFGKS